MHLFRHASLVAISLLLIVPVGCGTEAGEADKLLSHGRDAYRKGDFDAVIHSCTEAIRLKPDFAEAYLGRGLGYERKGDHDRAIADYTEAIRLKPDYVAPYYHRSAAYELRGDTTRAQADLAQVSQLLTERAQSNRVASAVSAPIVYEELMLVLSNEDGAAAITFAHEIKRGVMYRYRYLTKYGKEESGEGEVFEQHKRLSGDTLVEAQVVNDRGKLTLEAGPLHLTWSFAGAGKGYIYYHPEFICVEIANARDFEKIDLNRFKWSGKRTGGR
jgi:tetratricopeptide (TPR) repeat protein